MRWMVVGLVIAGCTDEPEDPTGGQPEPCELDEWYEDADRDGFGAGDLIEGCEDDRPLGAADVDGDCNDDDPDVSPDGVEVCNGIDDDCDGGADDLDPDGSPTDGGLFFADDDGDGFGDLLDPRRSCAVRDGIVDDSSDCNDQSDAVFPGAPEICNGIDDDCNDEIDDDATDATTFYVDADNDTFGDPSQPVLACDAPSGTVPVNTDCDDQDDAVFPGALEVCNGIDDDCDNGADDLDPDGVPSDAPTFWSDGDNDGFGDPLAAVVSCVQPPDTATNPDDCNDGDDTIRPFATETCDDTIDRNCDGSLPTEDNDNDGALACEDCNDADPNVVAPREWYFDGDGDDFGTDQSVIACFPPADHVAVDGDCNDQDRDISPAAAEVCDGGVDNDCNQLSDEADPGTVDVVLLWLDSDGDGFGADGAPEPFCTPPNDYVAIDGDCDDSNDQLNPDTIWWADTDGDGLGDANVFTNSCLQPPDTADNPDDCDDSTENITFGELYYPDGDGDGFGDETAVPERACVPAADQVLDNTDCNDGDGTINPDTRWWTDGDTDGLGDPANETMSCLQPPGTVGNPDDCDDSTTSIGAATPWYADTDGDGFGDPAVVVAVACVQPAGAVDNDLDCDDGDQFVTSLTWYQDADDDGFGDPTVAVTQCTAPAGFVADDQDCDDASTLVWPGRFDFGDTIDNDCDTLVDEDVGNETVTASDVQMIVNARCGACHTTGSTAGLTMGVPPGVRTATVGVQSSQSPSMSRVVPGDPDNSYVWLKLLGQGSGSRMPPAGSLPQSELDTWETWIFEGAAP